MQMVDDNVGNQVRHNAVQNDGNKYGNGNVETTPAEGNGNPLRCYNCQGEGHYANAYKETKRVKVNFTSKDTLQQASTSGTQSDNALVYDSDGSTEVPKDENCYDHDIFNMLTHEVQYTDLQTELDQCKYDKISYDNAYNGMQQKIKQFQAQLRDLKGKSGDTQCALNTLDSMSWKLKDEIVTNPSKTSRIDNVVPNKHVKAIVGTKPIIFSQPHVITKNDVNSKTNGFSPKDVKITTGTRRPLPRNNHKNDKVPSKSKSSWLPNNLEKIEENHMNLQSSSNKKHMSSECNNIKLNIWNAKSKVVCAMCKQCLIIVNHDVCVLDYVNDMNSHALNKNANVSNVKHQKKHKPNVRKPKKVGSKERLASPKPSTPRSCLRWSPTGRIFDLKGKMIATSESVYQSDCSKGDNACTSNP
nr:hypothetical protein [Tanacetum cinerariifolium]